MGNYGNLVKIMANHDTWNACQDHGKIMARSWQDLGKILGGSWQDNHGNICELYNCIIYSFQKIFFASLISEQAVVITSDITFIYRKKNFKLKSIQHFSIVCCTY